MKDIIIYDDFDLNIKEDIFYFSKFHFLMILLKIYEDYKQEKLDIYTYSISAKDYFLLKNNIKNLKVCADETMKFYRKNRNFAFFLKEIRFAKIHIKTYIFDDMVIFSSANVSSKNKTEFFFLKKICKKTRKNLISNIEKTLLRRKRRKIDL